MGKLCKRFKHKCFFFVSLYFILNFVLFSQELVVKCTGVDIHGTLLEPSSSKVRTLCIIVPGSGPTDRDGNNIVGMQTNAYRLLAEELQNQGIASFRYDKRAIGKSIVTNLKEEEMSFETNVEDLKTIIADLKALKKFNKIFLIGHSEGSLVSILTAKTEKVDGIVSIAGVGKSAGELIINQIEANPANPQELKENAKNIVKKLQNKQRVPILDINPMLRTLFRESVQPYLISYFKIEPREEIAWEIGFSSSYRKCTSSFWG